MLSGPPQRRPPVIGNAPTSLADGLFAVVASQQHGRLVFGTVPQSRRFAFARQYGHNNAETGHAPIFSSKQISAKAVQLAAADRWENQRHRIKFDTATFHHPGALADAIVPLSVFSSSIGGNGPTSDAHKE